ncbi:hypothetical protein DEA8626_00919 [Defluviimonas aquaemixtae]|uniref:DUF1203 domain-containing protein n=1 Tax=Albidovulum aquaemixtae TaxID=1542388 RepID=A0A2R8B422_9RHOB|nr:DUF1203 domain-containing protein [Defluviimonas aquaemixtae]SPH17401.1 hypothetical protein DEA8626_00919 [Defluviimonas aquaemixtae]
MRLHYEPMDSDMVRALRAGGPDANGQPPERGAISTGQGEPCRHCLGQVPDGAEFLILAHRPFPALQPYAECGPIFLCAEDCAPWHGEGVPPILKMSPDYLLKGYTDDHRIFYGTGRIVPQDEVSVYAATLLDDPRVAFVDVRSARNNCFQVRIRRAE